jgi:pyruvate ferredoxin oxidoreductase delta subunit
MRFPVSKPGTSLENKTGDWRTFKPEIDGSKCIKCATCQRFCPEGCMGEQGKVPIVGLDYCKGCGICANECPVKCITMVSEK